MIIDTSTDSFEILYQDFKERWVGSGYHAVNGNCSMQPYFNEGPAVDFHYAAGFSYKMFLDAEED